MIAITKTEKTIRYVDLFCGIGGFRYATEGVAEKLGIRAECVMSSDIDQDCQKAYEINFKERPSGDIHAIDADSIPDHNILLAGFPCQPFSIIGNRKGFEDARGTLFFEIARILEAKNPQAFVLENVKLLAGHNGVYPYSCALRAGASYHHLLVYGERRLAACLKVGLN